MSTNHSNRYERQHRLNQKGISTLRTPLISWGFNGEGQGRVRVACFDSIQAAERYLRNIRHAGKNGANRGLWSHNGWYSDADQSETIKPLIAQWGHRIFSGVLTAWGQVEIEMDGGYLLDLVGGDYAECCKDAARCADSIAERQAEREREYSEKWQEARRLEEEREELTREREMLLQDARSRVRGAKESRPLSPSLCEVIRRDVTADRSRAGEILRRVKELSARIAELPE